MPKRLSKKRPPTDPNVSAFRALQHVIAHTDNPPRRNVVPIRKRKDPAAVALGRKGGQASAVARMVKITPEERRRIASHAARALWAKRKGHG